MELVQAAAVVTDITPALEVPMGGYGARVGGATAIHDPILARTLLLSDGATELVLIICDVVGIAPELAAQTRDYIERLTGIPPAHVAIAATHTHSGPLLQAHGYPDHISYTARKLAGSLLQARRELRPATLKVATAEVSTISQNRRDPAGPIERTARILLVAPEEGGEPVATVVNYACHATVLEYWNNDYSADFPGAMCRAIERIAGGVAFYMQGASGDINPAWMRHDHTEVDRVGGLLGAAAARAVHELRPLGEHLQVVNLSWNEDLPVAPAPGTVVTGLRLAAESVHIAVPRRVLPSQEELEAEYEQARLAYESLPESAVEERRAHWPRVAELRMARSRKRNFPASPGDTQLIELQAFRLGNEAAILMLPGEFFVAIGQRLQARTGVEHLFIQGYANDFISYVPGAEDFAHSGYEIGCALFAPESADLIVTTALELVGRVQGGPR